ncbi:MAG: AAA family ATPase [Methylococcaceae bacterium]|nr:AAA family ATPase [Methylococcaceae bacterium]
MQERENTHSETNIELFQDERLAKVLANCYSWSEKWIFNASVGQGIVIGNLLRDIEEILGEGTDVIDFLRVIEEDKVGEPYSRAISVFLQPTAANDAQKKALNYAVMRAEKLARTVCYRCGYLLENTTFDEDDPILEKLLSNTKHLEFSTHHLSICRLCLESEHGVVGQENTGEANEDEKNEQGSSDDTLNKETDNKTVDKKKADNEESSDKKKAGSNNSFNLNDTALVTVYNSEEVDQLEKDYRGATRDHSSRVKTIVKRMRASTPEKKLVAIPKNWKNYCNALDQKFPNFTEVIDFLRNQIALSSVGDKVLRFPPFLLVGQPGIGKTEFMLSIAEDFKTRLEIVDVANAQTGATLAGSEAYWSNTKPGTIFTTLVFGEVANAIIMLDEIDKSRQDDVHRPIAALLQLLENRQAREFHDLSLPELAIDASHIIWIATANCLETIDSPIVDRFVVFHIKEPNKQQMPAIVKNQYDRFIKQNASGVFFEKKIRKDTLIELCKYHPRNVRKILEQSFGLAAREERKYITVNDILACKTNDEKRAAIGFMNTNN